jgi:hypothetical protein
MPLRGVDGLWVGSTVSPSMAEAAAGTAAR